MTHKLKETPTLASGRRAGGTTAGAVYNMIVSSMVKTVKLDFLKKLTSL